MKSRPLVAALALLAGAGPSHGQDPTSSRTSTFTLPGGGAGSVTVTTSGTAAPRVVVNGREVEEGKAGNGRTTELLPFMGVSAAPVHPSVSAHLDLPRDLYLAVESVQPGSPAAQQGLREQDILTHLDDQILVNPQQFQRLVRMRKPGDEVTVRLLRSGKEQTVRLKLAEREASLVDAPPLPAFEGGRMPDPFWQGAQLPDMRDQLRRMQEQMERMRHERLFDPQLGGEGGAHRSSSSSRSASMANEKGRFTFTENNGSKHFRAEDPEGKVLFDGPVDTDAQREKVPGDLHPVLGELEADRASPPRGPAQGKRRPSSGNGI